MKFLFQQNLRDIILIFHDIAGIDMIIEEWKSLCRKYKNYKTLNTILVSVDSIVIIGATSFSITLSVTGVGLMISPTSAEVSCTLSLGNKVLHTLAINKHNKHKKLQEKDKQTI